MSAIETLGLGAGSYPEPIFDDLQEYVFEVVLSAKVKISAKSELDARAILEELTEYEIASDSEELEIRQYELDEVIR